MKGTIGIVMATSLEARPLIDRLRLKNDPPCYINDRFCLIIGGIGAAAAEQGAAKLIARHNPDLVVNLGAAGTTAAKGVPGDIYAIDRVTRFNGEGSEPLYEPMDILEGFPLARLITVSRPVLHAGDRERLRHRGELIDMEGAGFLRACRAGGKPAYCFKFISDTGAHEEVQEIIDNIRLLGAAFCRTAAESILPLLMK